MGKFQTRRAWILWLPTVLTGAILNALSYVHAPTFNGLTLVGAVLIVAGVTALALDNREAT